MVDRMYNSVVSKSVLAAGAFALLLAAAGPARAAQASFDAQAQKIFRVALCGGEGQPAEPSQARHCQAISAAIAEYKKEWLDQAMPFIASLRPKELPPRVLYPYGGGDLVTALAVFPDATLYTTISLESVGDPRGVDALSGEALERSLGINRHNVVRLMRAAFSATTELSAGETSDLPGQLILAMAGLVAHGYEPVGLRYFALGADGALVYVTDEEVAAYDAAGRKKKGAKKSERELRQHLFSNAELTFRKRGDAKAPLKTYRHIAANLYDRFQPMDGPLMSHLRSLGRISAMTKAASHLLWARQSGHMRAYLLAHMDWMLSDATGIPHPAAVKAGFEQVTYGKYVGAYFEHRNPEVERDFVKLWKDSPARELPFRFGYFDKSFNSHMLVTRPAKK
jgi:hypothetical protein